MDGATTRLVTTPAILAPPSPPTLQPLYFNEDLCQPTPTGNLTIPNGPMSPSGLGPHIVEESIYPSLRFEDQEEDEKLDGSSGSEKKRISTTPPLVKDSNDEENDEEQLRKEREGIRRRLEYNKAKRRSTMRRVSVGGSKAPLVQNRAYFSIFIGS